MQTNRVATLDSIPKAVEIKPSTGETAIKNSFDQIYFKELESGVRRIQNELHKLGFFQIGAGW
jgi:hypothetical protein